MRDSPTAKRKVRIVEEVPGVPEDERYFISGGDFAYPYPHFSSKVAAEVYLESQGITDYVFEGFVP